MNITKYGTVTISQDPESGKPNIHVDGFECASEEPYEKILPELVTSAIAWAYGVLHRTAATPRPVSTNSE